VTDTRDEVERIRALYAAHETPGGTLYTRDAHVRTLLARIATLEAERDAARRETERESDARDRLAEQLDAVTAERDALAARLAPAEAETPEDRAADVAYMVRASQTLPHHLIDVRAGDVVRWLREIADARQRLPSPAAVRAARVLAAEVIERRETRDAFHLRDLPSMRAAELRDLARTYLGTRDEGGDVDATTLAMIALDVDGLATLGELEEMARELREVE